MLLHCVRLPQCAQGTPIKSGQEIRLQHIATRRWLHSHRFSSPLSNNQEVRWGGGGGWAGLPSCLDTCCRCATRHRALLATSHHVRHRLLPRAQVSCFGDDKNSDSGDVWRVEWDDSSMAAWRRDAPVRLLHKDTGAFLSTRACCFRDADSLCALRWAAVVCGAGVGVGVHLAALTGAAHGGPAEPPALRRA